MGFTCNNVFCGLASVEISRQMGEGWQAFVCHTPMIYVHDSFDEIKYASNVILNEENEFLGNRPQENWKSIFFFYN